MGSVSEERNGKAGTDYAAYERPLFEAWKSAGYFKRSRGFGSHAQESYTIVIPPPNVTGVLHIGHALNDTIQDACIRRARMQGYQTRWILGTDHAGIATQTKVDKHLAEQGINRREIGREKFIEACQQWRLEYGTTIVNQIAAMGCSCDYDDEKFTMSPEFSRAVRKVFTDWYHDGLIYRGKRIVNWCPSCTTAIADDEAEYVEEAGHLWYLRYPLAEPVDGKDYVVVATTRPETMLGDTGVAVNPQDGRYADLIGKSIILPLVNREIPIFADFYVDASFGTGCVKVTPAHDPNDYAMGERANLPKVNIFDETAHVVEGFGDFSGLSREEAREAVVAAFDEQGLLDHVEDHDHSVMHCYRCHATLEPWLSEQWFVAVDALKEKAAAVVEDGSIAFHPDRWSQVYLDWLANLKDWCISRQLWWGHRIPMYYCDACGWQDASVDEISECPTCGAVVRQDEDVLDTWFSSQLWPFATQGWADAGAESSELEAYYPTQVLSTARDIMGLWLARMVMASEYCTGEIPFENVIIHPTVMGADGKPMSKSRGNGVDPLQLMADYGADGMRFGLLTQVTGAQAMRFDYQKIESARNFANKIRNAARFVLMHLEGFVPGDPELLTPADRWVFSRLARLVAEVDAAFESYEFSDLTRALYGFFWNEFCDWYIEFSKSRLREENDPTDRLACQRNLMFVLNVALRLLHPVMPFITESIYQDMPEDVREEEPWLIGASWPDASALASYHDEEAEHAVDMVCEVIGAIRSARARYGISPKVALNVVVRAHGSDIDIVEGQSVLIASLANVGDLAVGQTLERPAESSASLGAGLEVYTCLSGHVDFDAERKRLGKECDKALSEIARLEKKLANPGFLAKAAPEVIDKDRRNLDELSDKVERLNMQLAELE